MYKKDESKIENGLKKTQQILGISEEELASILGTTSTAFSDWINQTAEPDLAHQERLENILTLLNEAGKAIRPEYIAEWFKESNALLNNLRPIDLLKIPSGTDKVRELLGSIKWGFPA